MHRRNRSLAALALAAAALLAPRASAQQDFVGCGEIIQGVTCPLLFAADSGGVWLLDDYGSFGVGDRVEVIGSADPSCPSICQQGGCIFQNSIEFCDVATPYCLCDAGAPCANIDPAAGCQNSTGSGATLAASGSSSVAADTLAFAASNLLPNQPALLFVGENAVNGGAGLPFGDGLRCAGGNVVRLGVDTPDTQGDASWGPGLAATGGWSAGDTRRFQAWYRDPGAGSPCGAGFNLSQGLEVTFTP
jgi:hypothetical protein